MIIQCKSCEKSFSVPDSAITVSGRLVQCGSCGNKWTQFPIVEKKAEKHEKKRQPITRSSSVKTKTVRNKKKSIKKTTAYTEEYLRKKHGIKIVNPSSHSVKSSKEEKTKSILGFYSYIIIFTIFLITIFGVINLTKEIIIFNYPNLEPHIDFLYETIKNIQVIITDIISNY